MVEKMLTARRIFVTYETIRQWDMKFGPDRQPYPSASPTPVRTSTVIAWATVIGVAMAHNHAWLLWSPNTWILPSNLVNVEAMIDQIAARHDDRSRSLSDP